MAILKIVYLPDPCLRQIAKPVETFDSALQTLIDDMFDTMYHARGVGLAAPQVGISKRLSVIDTEGDKQNQLVIINPEIIRAEGEQEYHEGCLSVQALSGCFSVIKTDYHVYTKILLDLVIEWLCLIDFSFVIPCASNHFSRLSRVLLMLIQCSLTDMRIISFSWFID